MIRILTVLAAALMLSGCLTTDILSAGVNRYCASTDEAERAVVRGRVAAAIAPHRIKVECGQ